MLSCLFELCMPFLPFLWYRTFTKSGSVLHVMVFALKGLLTLILITDIFFPTILNHLRVFSSFIIYMLTPCAMPSTGGPSRFDKWWWRWPRVAIWVVLDNLLYVPCCWLTCFISQQLPASPLPPHLTRGAAYWSLRQHRGGGVYVYLLLFISWTHAVTNMVVGRTYIEHACMCCPRILVVTPTTSLY